jgi:hypothetical protein
MISSHLPTLYSVIRKVEVKLDKAKKKLNNLVLNLEIDKITPATGKNDIHSLGYYDLITTNIYIST